MSRIELVQCDRDGCDEWFTKKTHNQRYHDDECCRLATNSRLREKYYDQQAQRKGKTRLCKSCQTTKLSRYNPEQVCSACKARKNVDANNEVLSMLSNTSFITN